jgi:Kef-type K+ transport system membrane component KefB
MLKMDDMTKLLGVLALMLVSAKLMGMLFRRIGQPPLLGEMSAGILLGSTFVGIVDPSNQVLHALSQLGFIIFLFQIGLELDIRRFLGVMPVATAVAVVGVLLPFALGFLLCQAVGLGVHKAVAAGAVITATSLGVTARFLSDLNRLEQPESAVILGAAILGNIFGLVMLGVVIDMTEEKDVSLLRVIVDSGLAYGFLLAAVLIGLYVTPRLFQLASRFEVPGTATGLAITVALSMAWLAALTRAAQSVGAFIAGLLVARTPQAGRIVREVIPLERVFVSIAFVFLGAQIDLRALNPVEGDNGRTILAALAVTLAAVAGKFAAGYAPFWFSGNKRLVGLGMIPHGEIGLVFAQMALVRGIFDRALFSAVAFAVLMTTFAGLAVLQATFPPLPPFDKEPSVDAGEIAAAGGTC